jgi:hypothetical protein
VGLLRQRRRRCARLTCNAALSRKAAAGKRQPWRADRAPGLPLDAATAGQEGDGWRLVPDRDSGVRGADLGAFATAAMRSALSLSAASLASRSARRRAVFSAAACCALVASTWELMVFLVLNCSSARRRPAPPGRGCERIDAASSLRVDDLTGQHLLPGKSLEPVSRGILGGQSIRRRASDVSPRFLSADDSMIPWSVVSHWPLDGKRTIVPVSND